MQKSLLHNEQTSQEQNRVLIKWMGECTSGGVQTYDQFLKQSSNQRMSQELIGKLKEFKKRLEKDSGHENIDPIRYLMRLYYLKGLTTDEILEEGKDKGLHYNNSRGLRSLFSNIFKWELLEPGKDHPLKVENRKTAPQVAALQKFNTGKTDKNTLSFNTKLLDIIGEQETGTQFSRKVYDSFTGKKSEQMNKVWYLLKCHENITPEMSIDIAVDAKLGARAIATILQNKIEVIRKQLDIIEELPVSVTYFGKALRNRKSKA